MGVVSSCPLWVSECIYFPSDRFSGARSVNTMLVDLR